MIISEWLFSQKCRFCQLQISTKVQKVPWTLISWQVFKETKCQLKFWHHSGNAINSGRGRRLKTSWTEKEQVAWRLQHWSNTNWVVGQQQKICRRISIKWACQGFRLAYHKLSFKVVFDKNSSVVFWLLPSLRVCRHQKQSSTHFKFQIRYKKM